MSATTHSPTIFEQLTLTLDNSLPLEQFLPVATENMGRVESVGLAAEISKGRLLSQVRETLVTQCSEGWEAEFKQFLKGHDLTPAKALKLIQLAGNAEEAFGDKAEQVADRMTRQAFYLAVDAGQEVRQLVKQQALESETVLKKGDVAAIRNEWDIVTSEILPESVKEKVQNGSLPAPKVAPLVKELNDLPEDLSSQFVEEIAASDGFDADELRQTTKDAKSLNKILDKLPLVACLSDLDKDAVVAETLQESLYIDLVGKVSVGAEQVQKLAVKLYQSHAKLSKEIDKLYCETGASTPHLRQLLVGLDVLAGETIKIETDKFSFSYSLQVADCEKADFALGDKVANEDNISQKLDLQEDLQKEENQNDYAAEELYYAGGELLEPEFLDDLADDFPSEEEDPAFFEELSGPVESPENNLIENKSVENSFAEIPFTQDNLKIPEADVYVEPQPVYHEFVDFMGRQIMVNSGDITNVDPRTVEECKALLKAVKTTDEIWNISADYEQSLNGSFASLKYVISQDEEITRHLFLVRLASDLQKTAGFYQEEKDMKANGKEVEISWATSKLEELRRTYPNDVKSAVAFLGQQDVAAYVLLKELGELVDAKVEKDKLEAVE